MRYIKMLTVLVAMLAMTLSTYAQTSGTCGDNLNWSYDGAGTLTITGSGAMYDYNSGGAPWNSYRANITSVSLPAGMTHIGNYAFYWCSIQTATFETGSLLETIGNYAFYYCSSLTAIDIPVGVTSLGVYSFGRCSKLETVTFAAGSPLTAINNYAFFYCSSLTAIDIPVGVTSIGEYAFQWCSSLNAIDIPVGVTSIGMCAFYKCSQLANVTVHWDAPITPGSYAFNYIASGATLHVPCGTSANYAAAPWSSFNIVEMNPSGKCGTTLYWEYDLSTHVLTITGSGAMTNYNATNSSPWSGFKAELSAVSLPNGLTNIGNYAFRECTALTTIAIPASVTSIGSYAFQNSSNLSTVTLAEGSSLTTIRYSAFYHCDALTSITLPASVTTIEYSAFTYCSNLSTVTLAEGSSLTTIQHNAFQYCGALTSITLPASVTTIDQNAFSYTGLTSIDIPAGVTAISNSVFNSCKSLVSVNLPAGVTTIGISAFYSCKSLVSINIPEGVTSIGGNAFSECQSLMSIHIPDGVTSIEDGVFCDCKALESLTIPASVTSIGMSAIRGCSSLTSIDIPASVTTIGDYTFMHDNKLSDVYVHWTDLSGMSVGTNGVFDYIASGAKLHVPCGTKSMYEATAPWNTLTIDENCVASADYTRPALTAGKIGTLYVGHATTSYEGATFYSIAGKSADGRSLTFEEVTGQLAANTPYIFEATGEDIKLYYADPSFSPDNEADANGLYGTLSEKHMGPSDDIFYISNNQLWRANTFSGGATDLTVSANRCWIAIDEVPALSSTPQPAPGKRYITLRTDGEMTATGIEEVESETAKAVRSEKILRDGQLLIIHGDKTYNALGQTVQ